jgi:predicted NAD/FAD-binding protein
MREVRNSDGRLVCRIDEATGTVEIRIKGCVTRIERRPDGKMIIVNTGKTA